MIYTGKKVYDPLTDTWSTGYWVKDTQDNWYPVWRGGGGDMKDKLISRNSLMEFANNSTVGIDANDIMRFPIVPAVPIPDNATNGEILCSIFPDMHYTLSEKTSRVVTTIGVASSFDIDWWNSSYKRGETE